MARYYGEQVAQEITGDTRWIRDIAAEGLVIFSKDNDSLCGIHRSDIEEHAAKVFIFPKANATGPQMAERFVKHRYRIAQRSLKPGPMIHRLYADSLKRVL
jgi:hypothetical protein